MSDFDVVILGGGAAGLMCALTAGRRGRRALVLESSNRVGKKILMSGGGRCNFTNLDCSPAHFLSHNPKFCTSALSRYTQWDFIALVEKHHIAYHEKTLGQLFCDESSKQIVALLQAECDASGVQILTHCEVTSVSHDTHFALTSSSGNFNAESLVIATGGLSIPKMGATDFGYRLARQFGHSIIPTRAGLVPFTFSSDFHELCARLSGVSLPAIVSAGSRQFAESILFTHRGLSGPAALQASSYWQPGENIVLNLLPGINAGDLLLQTKTLQPKALLRTILAKKMPRALVLELQHILWPDLVDESLGDISNERLQEAARCLQNWRLRPAATEGYRSAEVTLGGIDSHELSSKTMESRLEPGLYCIGEVVDVTGHLGGFNFQWAWASGHAAGQFA
ncbi:MAG TPA: NAD(P)/FAD-dependent oxidoreductase [Woeseiaceae bacterium]|nr:NAD(P)/FAD-dependent oxidoreductase [Woeseiaceae bacterium]